MNNLFEYTEEEIQSCGLLIPSESEIDLILEKFVNFQIEAGSASGSHNPGTGSGGFCTCSQYQAGTYDDVFCVPPCGG